MKSDTTSTTRKLFLTARWQSLVMLNYVVDPAILRPLVPPGTELDSWNGRTYLSVVGFLFQNTRVFGVPIPFHRHFAEINLRFYVRREIGSEVRRGVVFVKEVVPRWAIARVARLAYNENYVCCPMASEVSLPTADRTTGLAEYRWFGPSAWSVIRAELQGEPHLPASGSEEEFITEHYWGYVKSRNGLTTEYRVEHPRWRVWQATSSVLEGDVAAFYGPGYTQALSAPPSSAFVAEGSAVQVFRGFVIAPS